jgi:hypothetical protein
MNVLFFLAAEMVEEVGIQWDVDNIFASCMQHNMPTTMGITVMGRPV